MAKSQYPVDGKPGKAWKVTSPFGWRMHPIKKTKKHHNGVDIWQGGGTTYLEACFDGKVVNVFRTTNPNSSGNRIDVQSTVMGKKITWTYFHMVDGSIQVKKGQKITAGQIVGKMGETGFATGKHVHWEIWAGHRTAQPNINSGGKGFYDPMKFMAATIEWEKAHAEAFQETPADAPVTVAPSHSVAEIPTVENPEEAKVVDPAEVVSVIKPVDTSVKPYPGKLIKTGSKGEAVKYIQAKLGITADGVFGKGTASAVKAFQAKHKLTADGVVGPKTWAKLG